VSTSRPGLVAGRKVGTTPNGAVPVAEPLLKVEGIDKSFGPIKANDGVSMSVLSGEVHALLGENGAGKSTLVKILYGVERPDRGRILIAGREETIGSPARARELGLGMVFQDLWLVPAFTVWENIALHLPATGMLLRPQRFKEELAAQAARFGLAVDPDAKVGELSLGERQRVELLKVLLAGARILILDEPTSALTPVESEKLFAVLRRIRATGASIILITHKLRDVRAVADRVTVLRQGQVTLAARPAAEVDDRELVEAMVGTSVQQAINRERRPSTAPPALELRSIRVRNGSGCGLESVSLEVRAGEILGIAGVAGNGQKELAEVAIGALRPAAGSVRVGQREVTAGSPAAFRAAGVVAVPADPMREFVVPGLSLAQHAALFGAGAVRGSRRRHTRDAELRLRAAASRCGLDLPDSKRRLDRLSGGNVQRVVLALALGQPAAVVVACDPTRGLDVRASEQTHALLLACRAKGSAILLISEDLDELLALCDRIAVIRQGRIVAALAAGAADRAGLGRLMVGEAT
jgi:ABC-type uncharacterized transport system ATPase subunit